MTNLITRDAVMRSLAKEYNERWDEKGLKLAYIEKAVNDTPSPWIPVAERLPETEERVLICTQNKKGVKSIMIGYYIQDSDYWAGTKSDAIAWMPLPEPWEELRE